MPSLKQRNSNGPVSLVNKLTCDKGLRKSTKCFECNVIDTLNIQITPIYFKTRLQGKYMLNLN